MLTLSTFPNGLVVSELIHSVPVLGLKAWQSMESDPSLSGIRELLFPDKDMCQRMLKAGERIGKRGQTNRTDLSRISHKVSIPREIGVQLSQRPFYKWLQWGYNFAPARYSARDHRTTGLDGGRLVRLWHMRMGLSQTRDRLRIIGKNVPVTYTVFSGRHV